MEHSEQQEMLHVEQILIHCLLLLQCMLLIMVVIILKIIIQHHVSELHEELNVDRDISKMLDEPDHYDDEMMFLMLYYYNI